jgi:hypothetical protein
VAGEAAIVASVLQTVARVDACLAEWVLARTLAALPFVEAGLSPPDEPLADGWSAALAGEVLGVGRESARHTPVYGWVPGCRPVVAVNAASSGEWAFALAAADSPVRRQPRLGLRGAATALLSPRPDSLAPAVSAGHHRVEEWRGRIELWRAAIAVGNGWAALESAATYAQDRYQGGKPLAEHATIQSLLGESALQLLAAQSLLQAASSVPRLRVWCGVFGTRAGERACWAAQQVLGGYGYMRDYPLEHRMRDAKVLAVLNGDGRRRIQAAVRAAEGGLAPWR